ncbi:DUF4760 domain-containing protein [Streptomyces sp. NPDC055099]
MNLNVVSLIVSAAALLASTWGIRSQINRARAASDLAMTTGLLLTTIREPEFQSDQRWVLFDLAREHSPEDGIDLLPEPANYRIWNVAHVYECVGIMLHFGIVNSDILRSIARYRLQRTWEVLRPYIEAERVRRGATVYPFFENAYASVTDTDPDALHRRLHLKRWDGTPR